MIFFLLAVCGFSECVYMFDISLSLYIYMYVCVCTVYVCEAMEREGRDFHEQEKEGRRFFLPSLVGLFLCF